jgi:hypothetical protein
MCCEDLGKIMIQFLVEVSAGLSILSVSGVCWLISNFSEIKARLIVLEKEVMLLRSDNARYKN